MNSIFKFDIYERTKPREKKRDSTGTPMILHTYSLVLHGTPLVFHWCSIGAPSYSSGISLELQIFFGVLRWYSKFFLEYRGVPVEYRGVSMEYQWSTVEYQWSTSGVRTLGVALIPPWTRSKIVINTNLLMYEKKQKVYFEILSSSILSITQWRSQDFSLCWISTLEHGSQMKLMEVILNPNNELLSKNFCDRSLRKEICFFLTHTHSKDISFAVSSIQFFRIS